MLRRYHDEPVPSERRAASTDELRPGTSTSDTSTTDTAELGEPEHQRGGSLQYHRPPIGKGVGTDVQHPTMGAEVKQAGAGRAFITPGLALPVQSPTAEPDRRRIARPMPSQARDAAEVIRPPQSGGQ